MIETERLILRKYTIEDFLMLIGQKDGFLGI